MYSGTVKYRVYKKDITHYRIEVFDPLTHSWSELTRDNWPDTLTLFNCKMVVDESLRLKTVQGLDGENAPVHAWIECESFIRQNVPLPNVLYYNPYTVSNFVDRMTMKVIDFCKQVSISGNKLYYSF